MRTQEGRLIKNIPEITIRIAMRLIARALGTGRLVTEAVGLERLPPRGPVLLLARHYHHLFDGVALYQVIQRHIHILVTLDWAPNQLIHHSMELLIRLARWPVILRPDALSAAPQGARRQQRSVFTAADVRRYQRKALADAIALLAEGKVLVIFPEGYPNIDLNHTPKTDADELLPFKPGFAAIAAAAERRIRSRVPIIPVGIRYVPGQKWTASLTFGKPVHLCDFSSRPALVRHIEREVAALSGLSMASFKTVSNN